MEMRGSGRGISRSLKEKRNRDDENRENGGEARQLTAVIAGAKGSN